MATSPAFTSRAGFDKGFTRGRLAPQELHAILKDYHDCSFTVNTTSCSGGGLANMMANFVDHPGLQDGRVTVITHTKESSINYEYYNNAMLRHLKDMADKAEGSPQNYGQAHLRADKQAKEIQGHGIESDAEAMRSRAGLPSLKTAQADKQKVPEAFHESIDKYHNGAGLADSGAPKDIGHLQPDVSRQAPQAPHAKDRGLV